MAAAGKQSFKDGSYFCAFGGFSIAAQRLAADKTFLISYFFLLLEMAQGDCSLHLSVVLMCYNKNNFTSLTASLVHLLLRQRISATGYICVFVKKQREWNTVTLEKNRGN